MLPEIRKILFASDLSDIAHHTFGYAASLANVYNAPIVILHVIEDLTANTLTMLREMVGEAQWNMLQQENQSQMITATRKKLIHFCDEMGQALPSSFEIADIIIATGHPVDQIISAADKNDCDIIVMGAGGKGNGTESMLGNTSRRVLRRTEKPVLTIQRAAQENTGSRV